MENAYPNQRTAPDLEFQPWIQTNKPSIYLMTDSGGSFPWSELEPFLICQFLDILVPSQAKKNSVVLCQLQKTVPEWRLLSNIP